MVGWDEDKNINTKKYEQEKYEQVKQHAFKKQIVEHMLETQLELVKKGRNIPFM